MRASVLLLGLLCAMPAFASDDEEFTAPDRSVALEAPAIAKLGIITTAATEQSTAVEAKGLGQVLGVDTLAQTDAELSIAESSARASASALERARNMFAADTGISRQALEQAEHQAATDAATLSLAQRKAQAQWGRDAPWKDAAGRRALMNKIASGAAVVIRATFPAAVTVSSMRVERFGAGKGDTWTAKTVWSAPADPAAPGHVYYLLLEDAKGLSEGERVRVVAAGAETKGAYVPASAVIIAEGATWVYVEEKAGYFVRQAIDLNTPSGAGYILKQVQPGEKVVTSGAGHLLARETGSAED